MPRAVLTVCATFFVLATGVLATGCGVSNIALRQDRRLHFDAPEQRARVTVPFGLRWRFDGSPPARYAVLVDQFPPPPGKTLAWLTRRDPTCRPAQGCPDAADLAARGVYVTRAPSLRLEAVNRADARHGHSEQHDITIVLLDARGRRVGESAWTRQIRLERVAR